MKRALIAAAVVAYMGLIASVMYVERRSERALIDLAVQEALAKQKAD